MNNTITITVEEHERLLWDSDFLETLESHGVDNWEGYANAYTEMMDE